MRQTYQLTNAFNPLSKRLFASQLVKVEDLDLSSYELKRNDEALLVKQPWTTRPFVSAQDFKMPIYNLVDGRYSGEMVDLDH